MSALQPFNPAYGSTVALVGAAGEVTSAFATPQPGGYPMQLLLTNEGTVTCYVRINRAGDTTAASVADLPVLANTQAVVTVALNEAFTVRLAAGATGSTLRVTQGAGF